jgi:hypothetical protein
VTLVQGTNTLLGDDPREIADVRLDPVEPTGRALPHWDGRSGERVGALLAERYAERSEAKATDPSSA